MESSIIVVGNGAWGTTLACLLAQRGAQVRVWGHDPAYTEQIERTRENPKYLPGVRIHEEVRFSSRVEDLRGADLVLCAVPAQHIRPVFGRLQPHVSRAPILSVTKGIEQGSLKRPSEVLQEVLGSSAVSVLSGPSHAEEVARGLPTTVVSAGDQAGKVQELFSSEKFRVYTGNDLVGVELAGALKNVIALAAGICDGLRLGDNAKASLLSRGVVEMARLGTAWGAKRSTFYGLSGIGDLITTCTSEHGRNLYVGRRIGEGKSLSEVLGGMGKVAEGVWTVTAVVAQAARLGVEVPIAQEVQSVLYERKDPRAAVRDLMARSPKSESEDLG
jgi:glycerol-3-phosphate dehydrogenase (NAD(P)+)